MQHLPPVYGLLLLLTLAGCGQTGPLYLPDKGAPQEKAPAQSQTETSANPG